MPRETRDVVTADPSRRRFEFPYGHGFFLQRLLLLSALAVFFVAFLAFAVPTPPSWLAVIGAALGVYVLVSGLSPLFTNHWLTASRLVLRQGWYFRTAVPFQSVESMEAYGGKPRLGLSAPWRRRRLYVTGSNEGLVAVRLTTPRRVWQVLGAEIDEIVFDVDSRDRFLEEFSKRRGSLAPVEAEGADADLGD